MSKQYNKGFGDVAPGDEKYVLKFNPDGMDYEQLKKHNTYVVEKTIKEYEETQAKKAKLYDDAYGERATAVISYLKSLDQGGKGHSNIEKYFSKRYLAYLRGQEIREQLMAGVKIKN